MPLRVFDKLRGCLTRFGGVDGYTALLRRALVLARAEVPALHRLTDKADGSLEGLEAVAADAGNSEVGGGPAAVAITAHLLGLLVTFIGEPLTVPLVREAGPDASLGE